MGSDIDYLYINPFTGIRSSSGAWYEVVKFLGKGGNGISYLVLCTEGPLYGCIFTLKILYRISKPERVEKFLQEVAFVKECNFPTILKHYDEGEWNDHPFVVMDYMTTTLEEVIKKGGLSIGDKILFAMQLLSAVKYLHDKNVVHRDIKPSNIFVKDNMAILGDFGLIKNLSMSADKEEDLKGYLAMPKSYRTPELVAYAKSQAPICVESDVFQLGLVLCELFTGKNPLKPSEDLLSDISLFPIPYTKNAVYLNKCIRTVRRMLKIDKTERMALGQAMASFSSLFGMYAEARGKIEGVAI